MSRKKEQGPEKYVQEAIDELVEFGCDEQTLRSLAITLIWLKPQMERRPVAQTRRELDRIKKKDLPLLSRAAKALERVNAHSLLGTAMTRKAWGLDSPAFSMFPALTPQQEEIMESVKMREALPNQIRLSSGDVEKKVKDLKKIFHLKGHGPGRDSVKFALISYVRESTSQPHYELISKVLFALGGEEKECMPENLQAFESRYRLRMQRSKRSRVSDTK
jgi:hypothetical protein